MRLFYSKDIYDGSLSKLAAAITEIKSQCGSLLGSKRCLKVGIRVFKTCAQESAGSWPSLHHWRMARKEKVPWQWLFVFTKLGNRSCCVRYISLPFCQNLILMDMCVSLCIYTCVLPLWATNDHKQIPCTPQILHKLHKFHVETYLAI